MTKLLAVLLAGFFAAASYAAPPVEAQMQRDPKGEAAAEASHLAKSHGNSKSAKQPEAQMAGSTKAQAQAEINKAKKGDTTNVEKTFTLKDGSSVYVFKDGKMAMEDKLGRVRSMKNGHVMETADGQSIMMVGNEMARLDWVRKTEAGGK